MAQAGEFPGNCLTNTIILHDFGEVAYIVCIVASPPTNNAVQPPSSETTLARLKHTEAQFRRASILAALDVDSVQLFTFYKKVDVMKDQRSLLAKFGNILRSNSCTIAYKAAARAQDILKLESKKLHRLFVSAILANVNVPAQENRQIFSLGQRYHVVESKVSEAEDISHVPTPWSLIRTDLQVVPSGHVLLTLAVDTSRTFVTIRDDHWQLRNTHKSQPNSKPVILAPFGQLATYNGGWIGSGNVEPGQSNGLPQVSAERLKFWRRFLVEWARTDAELTFEDDGEEIWVELQLPQALSEHDSLTESEAGRVDSKESFDFKQIFWPANLCFIMHDATSASDAEGLVPEDPVKFVQDWISTAKERLAEAEEANDLSSPPDNDDTALFADETAFDNPEAFQAFGPPAFPAGQTIYPTPPDVVMTHATSGMSSVDGLAMTPANAPRVGWEPAQPSSQELEMTDVDPTQAAAVGSGYYDEDLFEEMPDDNFGPTGTGDEPNWDFFDKPDLDVDPREPEQVKVIDTVDRHESGTSNSERRKVNFNDTGADVLSPLQEEACPTASATGNEQSPVDRVESRQHPAEPFSDLPLSADPLDHLGKPEQSPASSGNGNTKERRVRRRSSIYEVLQPSAQPINHDTRYTPRGVFWFDTGTNGQPMRQSYSLVGWSRRTPSSSSASDSSTSEGEASPRLDEVQHDTAKFWTTYEPLVSLEEKPAIAIDTNAIEEQVRDIFNHLRVKSTSLALENTIQASKKPTMGIPKGKPGLSLMISQIFVDQVSQSALFHSFQRDMTFNVDASLLVDLDLNLMNLNSSAAYANLSQLSGIPSVIGSRAAGGKLVRLADQQITFKRGDKQMMASTSIIPFWDTLGLQPQTRSKDVTAFCIHPPGSGIADGCANFLDRVADAYGSCNLGIHKTGKISNLTDTGLLTWSPERDKIFPMFPVAIRLGEALAFAEAISGTVLIYIVGSSGESASYIQCSASFYACYQAYQKNMSARSGDLELVLQVIPAPFVASTETIVVPCQLDYNGVALEVYSRIPPPDLHGPTGSFNFPMTLADTIDSVRFNLEPSPTSPLTSDGICLHLAYSYSDDQRWIVACWSDDTGQIALTMTYLLRTTATDRGRPEADIFKDMWEVSQDLMKPQRSGWRLIIARIGFYGAAEENIWAHLVNAEVNIEKPSCTLQLLTVELSPTLQISAPVVQTKGGQARSSSQANIYGTPASTPQAITTSPEQLVPATPTPGGTSAVNAATPPDHGFDANIDGDLSLNDPIEESWLFIPPCPANQSFNILEVRQAKASGYLMKRLGPKDEDGVSTIGVHLIHTPDSPAGATSGQLGEALEDIINRFRGLCTLTSARGLAEKGKQCAPWHVCTAAVGASGLSGLI